jgi:crotonobetainyl-CoA:carnitine CoA-transferase CaiB-like acyl-CoA transferase
MTKPLQNIRVVDLTVALAGPFCTQQLAAMGAEVLFVDPPWGGYQTAVFSTFPMDFQRRILGPLLANKKHITLNLRHEKGKTLLLELAKKSDVLVQNFSPGTMEKLGLPYEVLKEANPKLVYCAISGFGQNGPLKNRLAYDPVIQAMTGLVSVNGFPDREPVQIGVTLSDFLGGLYAAFGILTALHARDTITGEGQMIDCAMFDASLSLTQEGMARSLTEGRATGRRGNSYPFAIPAGTYPTGDGKMEFIACQTDKQFNTVMKIIGREDIAAKDWKLAERVKHRAEVDNQVSIWTASRTQQDIEEVLIANDIPCAPIMDMLEVANHPHTAARNMLNELPDKAGTISGILGVVPKLLGTPGRQEYGLMESGSFNEEVYGGLLGMSAEEMARYKEEGVI